MNPLLNNNNPSLNYMQQLQQMQQQGVTPQSAQQQMQQALSSGQISQQEFNDLVSKAKQIGQMLGLPV